MKNLTLRINEKTLAAARKAAALRETTVAKLVREFLEKLVAEDRDNDAMYSERFDSLRKSLGFAEAARREEIGAGAGETNEAILGRSMTVIDDRPEPGHDEWFRQKVQATLDKKESGKMKYTSLAKVAARYGFNAR